MCRACTDQTWYCPCQTWRRASAALSRPVHVWTERNPNKRYVIACKKKHVVNTTKENVSFSTYKHIPSRTGNLTSLCRSKRIPANQSTTSFFGHPPVSSRGKGTKTLPYLPTAARPNSSRYGRQPAEIVKETRYATNVRRDHPLGEREPFDMTV